MNYIKHLNSQKKCVEKYGKESEKKVGIQCAIGLIFHKSYIPQQVPKNWLRHYLFPELRYRNGNLEFPIVKDTILNITNPRLYIICYNKVSV